MKYIAAILQSLKSIKENERLTYWRYTFVFGIFVEKVTSTGKPQVEAQFFTKDMEVNEALLKEMIRRFKETNEKYCILLGENYKVVGVQLNAGSLFVGFFLDPNEDSAPVLVNIDQKRDQILKALKGGSISTVIKDILEKEEEVTKKLLDAKVIKDRIIAQTNVLLDKGDFEKAKKLISLAEEIPPKLTAAVAAAEKARLEQNYRNAEKLYKDASDLAVQIGEKYLEEVLIAKADRVKQLPAYEKRQKSTVQKLQKPQEDRDFEFLNILVNDIIAVSDFLEDEEIIGDLRQLNTLGAEAATLKKELELKEAKMKEIIARIIKKRS